MNIVTYYEERKVPLTGKVGIDVLHAQILAELAFYTERHAVENQQVTRSAVIPFRADVNLPVEGRDAYVDIPDEEDTPPEFIGPLESGATAPPDVQCLLLKPPTAPPAALFEDDGASTSYRPLIPVDLTEVISDTDTPEAIGEGAPTPHVSGEPVGVVSVKRRPGDGVEGKLTALRQFTTQPVIAGRSFSSAKTRGNMKDALQRRIIDHHYDALKMREYDPKVREYLVENTKRYTRELVRLFGHAIPCDARTYRESRYKRAQVVNCDANETISDVIDVNNVGDMAKANLKVDHQNNPNKAARIFFSMPGSTSINIGKLGYGLSKWYSQIPCFLSGKTQAEQSEVIAAVGGRVKEQLIETDDSGQDAHTEANDRACEFAAYSEIFHPDVVGDGEWLKTAHDSDFRFPVYVKGCPRLDLTDEDLECMRLSGSGLTTGPNTILKFVETCDAIALWKPKWNTRQIVAYALRYSFGCGDDRGLGDIPIKYIRQAAKLRRTKLKIKVVKKSSGRPVLILGRYFPGFFVGSTASYCDIGRALSKLHETSQQTTVPKRDIWLSKAISGYYTDRNTLVFGEICSKILEVYNHEVDENKVISQEELATMKTSDKTYSWNSLQSMMVDKNGRYNNSTEFTEQMEYTLATQLPNYDRVVLDQWLQNPVDENGELKDPPTIWRERDLTFAELTAEGPVLLETPETECYAAAPQPPPENPRRKDKKIPPPSGKDADLVNAAVAGLKARHEGPDSKKKNKSTVKTTTAPVAQNQTSRGKANTSKRRPNKDFYTDAALEYWTSLSDTQKAALTEARRKKTKWPKFPGKPRPYPYYRDHEAENGSSATQ